MSLQVWLPLDGTLQNKGLSDVEVTEGDATVDANGKIGKCYSFNGSQYIKTTLPSSLVNLTPISIAIWVYSTSSTMAVGGISHDSNATQPGLTLFSSGWQVMGTGASTYKYVSSGTIANTSVWHHAVCTVDDSGNITTYLDGNKVTTNSLSTLGITGTTFTSANFIELGCDHPGGNEYFTGKLNDLRIYDHCLSPKEVKELSKGLVAHYPLNDGIGNPNEIVNSLPWTISGWIKAGTGWSNELVENNFSPSGYVIRTTHSGTGANSGGAHHQARDYTQLEDGEVYTLSAWIRASEELKVNFHNELMTSHSPAYPITVNTEWKKYTMTGPIDLSKQYHSNTIYSTGAGVGDGTWIEVCMLKLEKGSVATPWIPNPADALYSELGLDDNIIYDCSGYGNNGINDGATTAIGSPKYTTCLSSDGTVNTRVTIGKSNQLTAAYQGDNTVTYWVYPLQSDSTARSEQILFGEDSSSGFYSYGTHFNVPDGRLGTRWANSSTGYGGSAKIIFNQWNFVAIEQLVSDSCVNLYINGNKIYDITSTDFSMRQPTDNTIWYLNGGKERRSNELIVPKSSVDGYLSDIRVYATALSDEDIKELYESSVSIDSHGNMWAYEIQEV